MRHLGRHRLAALVALEESCSPRTTSTSGSAGRADDVRLLRHRAGAADLARRRRVADLRDLAAPPRPRGPAAGTVLAGARARRRGDARFSRRRLSLAIGHYDVGGYVWVELAFVVLTLWRAFVLFSTSLHPICIGRAAGLQRLRVEALSARRVPRGARLPDEAAAARGVFALTRRSASGPCARHLVRREGRRSRPLAAAVLRDGAAALPRHARAVHDQRACGTGIVLRELPRRLWASPPTRPSRPASSSSSSRSRPPCREPSSSRAKACAPARCRKPERRPELARPTGGGAAEAGSAAGGAGGRLAPHRPRCSRGVARDLAALARDGIRALGAARGGDARRPAPGDARRAVSGAAERRGHARHVGHARGSRPRADVRPRRVARS